ncbi:MAG TPA: SGNH/GDSL hydrolase family protein [Ktedonobacterales bacterium]|nr:SGNH/GDSL hydrolase family protein [Ktedonobacterales bacterium]
MEDAAIAVGKQVRAGRPSGRRGVGYAVSALVLIVVLAGMDILLLNIKNPAQVLGHHYYLALGDSISFGYQPNLNFSDGFVDQVFAELQKANITDLTDYACAGDSSTTMIQGDCPGRLIKHDAYTGPQLTAALDFIGQHRGQVSPITLEIGSNDVLPDFDSTSCTASDHATADLATLDANLTQTIFPQLLGNLTSVAGPAVTNLYLLNYYNPFAKQCPDSTRFAHTLNDHLAADAAKFKIPVVDIYGAFGGDDHQADHICDYTWVCNAQYNHDFHPTTLGYSVIAATVERALGYPGIGPSRLPIHDVNPPIQSGPSQAALRSTWA